MHATIDSTIDLRLGSWGLFVVCSSCPILNLRHVLSLSSLDSCHASLAIRARNELQHSVLFSPHDPQNDRNDALAH